MQVVCIEAYLLSSSHQNSIFTLLVDMLARIPSPRANSEFGFLHIMWEANAQSLGEWDKLKHNVQQTDRKELNKRTQAEKEALSELFWQHVT